MAKKDINLGTQPTGAGGDTSRSANVKINANFTELYKAMGAVLNKANSGAEGAVLPEALPIANGGTGATKAADARTNLGLGSAATKTAGDSAGNVLELPSAFNIGNSGQFKNAEPYPIDGGNTFEYFAAVNIDGVGSVYGGGVRVAQGSGDAARKFRLFFHANGHMYTMAKTNTSNPSTTTDPEGKNHWSKAFPVYAANNPIAYNTTVAEYPNLVVSSTGELKRSTQTLGTAARGTLTTSIDDNTAGRVLKVGDFGLGARAYDVPISIEQGKDPNLSLVEALNNKSGFVRILGTGSSLPQFSTGFYARNAGRHLLLTGDAYGQISFLSGNMDGSTPTIVTGKLWTTANTTVDSNGFVKSASPIIELYADRIELNDEAKQQTISFKKLGIGDYLIKGSSGFAQSGWYVEQPKDANGNVYHAVIYDTLENGDISVKTYEQKLDGVKIVADLDKPVDIQENRFISIRLQKLPQEPIEEPQLEPTITDYQGNPAPSRLHELDHGIWVISEENAAVLEQERLEKMPDLTRRQFRMVLVLNGYDLANIETLINSIEDPMQRQITMIEWQDATTFHRTNPSLITMAGLMGLDAETVDQLWTQALTL